MSDLSWIYNYGFLGTRLFELPSLLICVLLILVLGYKFKISPKYQAVLTLHCFLPFVLNNVLFNASYMPDQFQYWRAVNSLRSGQLGVLEALTSTGNVNQASIFWHQYLFLRLSQLLA